MTTESRDAYCMNEGTHPSNVCMCVPQNDPLR